MRLSTALSTLTLALTLSTPALAAPPPQATVAAQVAALPMPTVTRRLRAHRELHARVVRFAEALGLPVKVARPALVASAR
ncbi:MAG: hypothetical protein H6702_13310 [Myxococcales bacterium]|nr:hypothetical protein [Myxococcales bacterium]